MITHQRTHTGRHRAARRPDGTRLRRRPAAFAAAAALIASTLVGLVTGSAPAVAATYQDWPTYLQNTSRTAATTDPNLSVSNASLLKLNWTAATGGPVATEAAVVGTTAYFGSWDGYEYAVSTVNGAVTWKTSIGITNDAACHPSTIGVTSSAAVVNGVVYVGGGDSYWYALDAASGAVLWKVFTGDNSQTGAHYNWSSPLIANGSAYVGVASNCDNPLVRGHLMKIDLASNQVVADYNFVPSGQLGGGIWTSPTYDAATNTVFVSSGTLNNYTQTQSQAIVALDATTLAYKSSWQLPFEAAVIDSDWGTTPTLTTDASGNQLLAVANKNGILYTFNRNNLAAGPVWQRQVAIGGACPTCGNGTIASGIFANGVLYFAGGNNVVNGRGTGGSITAFDPGSGNTLWVRQTDQAILGSPAYVNGMIGQVEGSTFEVVNASNGALLYSYVLPASVYGGVSIAQSQFYVGALDGKLYAFGLGAAPAPPPADSNCPAGFTCQDVHKPARGSEQTTGGALTVTASGTGIKGTGDQFRFISKPVTGDAQTSAQIVSQTPQPGQVQQAGIMVRQSVDAGSPFFAVLAYPNDSPPDLQVWYRSAFAKNPVLLRKIASPTLPVSVMIQRTGNQFSAGLSTDGSNYQLIAGASATVDLPTTTLQGLAVDSGSSTNYGTATFANLAVGAAITSVMAPQPPADPCPGPWTCGDIGNPNPVGDTTAAGGSYTLAGAGSGFGGTSDSMHYVYQQVSGNQSISAQVVTQSGAPAKAQDGLMMRANTSPTSPMYSVSLNPGGSATIQWRVYDGIKTSQTVPLTGTTSPAYLQIVRFQDTRFNPPATFFSTQTSPDGATWTPVLGSTVAIDLGSDTYQAGLAATAGAANVTTPAVFNNVAISPANTPPPGICPQGFTCGDIGTGIKPGNQIYLNGTWTMQAQGTIFGVYDTFRFAYENFPNDPANSANGDGTISARVVSQAGGTGWMRSGVMIRSGTDPQAPYYGVFVTPQNGVVVQWRPTKAANVTEDVLPVSPATTAPLWVLASRYTDTVHNVVYYSAFTSTDGVNFTFAPGSTTTLNLPGPLVAGIASDANSANLTSVATIDNVAELAGSNPPPNICPSAWSCTDIGGALPPGQDQLSGGTWSELGGGGDIWGTGDSFHFVSQTLSADGTVTAHVLSQQNTSAWAKAGPMVRATTDAGSPYYGVFVTPGSGISVQWRTTQGGGTGQLLTAGTVPAYLMIGRYTTTGTNPVSYYTAYTSPDGSKWTPIPGSTVNVNLTGALLAGFAITSHNQGTGSAVTLDSVGVTSGELAPPGVCPIAWQCADIGTATPAGGQTLSGSAWTIQGGGNDIWGTADAFHYVWQSLAGDGSITARVTSQTNTSAWAKAGLMMRASTDPGSPYFAVFLTPTNGIAVQWRTAQGSTSSQALTPGTVPVYLQLTRTGSTFTAATSSDGTTWTPVPGASVSLGNLSGTLLRGFAVTSHNTGAVSTVGMDTVTTTP